MSKYLNLLLTMICVVVGYIGNDAVVAAEPPHPYHVSMAEVNWNPKSQKFEVALCLWPADLEKALAQQTGRAIDLAKEPNVDQLMEAYVSKRFNIRSKPKQWEQQEEQKPITQVVEDLKSRDAGDRVTNASGAVATNNLQAAVQVNPAPKPAAIRAIAVTVPKSIPTPQKLKWYGHEADAKQVWLFFEIAGDAGANWSVESRVFFELNDDQLNHVQWNGTGKTETLVCNADNPKISLLKK